MSSENETGTRERAVAQFLGMEVDGADGYGAIRAVAESLDECPTAQSEYGQGSCCSYLLFREESGYFALETRAVREVLSSGEPARVPFVRNPRCLGFIAFHGRSIPLINLRLAIEIPGVSSVKSSRRVIVFSSGDLLSAIEVDELIGIEHGYPLVQERLAIRNGVLTTARLSRGSAVVLDPDALSRTLVEGER